MKRSEKIRVKRQCAHCGKVLGFVYWERKNGDTSDEITTHGICPECQKIVIAEAVAFKEKLDSRLHGDNAVYI